MLKSPMTPFVAPFLLFMAFLVLEGWWPDQHYLLYIPKTFCVGAVILYYWRSLPTLTPRIPIISILIGLVGVVLWIGLDPFLVHYDQPLLGRNPFHLYPPAEAWALFAVRLFGISVVVPIMEELFWRGFLMRWLIKEDFTAVPLGTYTPLSFFVTTAFFAAEHGPEWPLGLIVGLLYGAWFIRTKSLGSVILAHSVTNFLLALYCLQTNDWHFLSIIPPPHR
jgi:CAAX prenyl protease-like protein